MRFRIPAALCLLAVGLGQPAVGQDVGIAASVVPDATGTPPRGQQRTLSVGLNVVRDERISTGPIGRTQMLFLDGSALTIGPNSDVVLDEFVYDPSTETGKLAVSATRGVLRLVGGKISKTEPVTLKTPTATLGIRGGIAIYDNGQATFLFGKSMTVTAPQADGSVAQVELTRPGTVNVTPGGQIGAVTPINAQAVAASLGSLEGSRGNSGGASESPTENRVAATQVAALGSTNTPAAVAPPAQAAAAATANAAALTNAITVASDVARDSSAVDTNVGRSSGDSGVRGFTGVGLVSPVFSAFNFADSSATHTSGFDRGLTGLAAGNVLLTFGSMSDSFAVLPFGAGPFEVSGDLAFGSSGRLAGQGFVNDSQSFFFYKLRELDRANNPVLLFGGVRNENPVVQRTELAFRAWNLVPGFPGDNQIPLLPAAFGGNIGNPIVSPLLAALRPNTPETSVPNAISPTLFAAFAVEGQGAAQKSALMIRTGSFFVDANPNNPTFGKLTIGGVAQGSVRLAANDRPYRIQDGSTPIFDRDGFAFYGLPSEQPSFVLGSDFYSGNAGFPYQDSAAFAQPFTNLNQSNEYYAAHPAVPAPNLLPAGIGASRTTRTMNGYIGGIAEARNATGSFQDYRFTSLGDPNNVEIATDAARNRLQANFRFQGSGFQLFDLVLGDLQSNNGSRSAFIDDRRFGARQSADDASQIGGANAQFANLAMVSFDVVPNSSFFGAGNGPCFCQYLTWGFLNFDAQGATGPRTRGHIIPWVAGELPALGTLPLSGTATYIGHAVGDVSNNGNRYIAGGGYTQSWDFAQQKGQATISNFDGKTFSTPSPAMPGALASSNGRDFFSPQLSGSGVSGTLNGSFVRGGGDPAAEVMGSFVVNAVGYSAAGIVAGRR